MGKRSDFEKNPRNYYRTFDKKAGRALRPHVRDGARYFEPFAGAGDLVDQLDFMECVYMSDIEPQRGNIDKFDAFQYTPEMLVWRDLDFLCSNPPWDREYFEPILNHFVPMIDCWFLMSSNWKQNVWASPYVRKWLTDIVPVGRLKWIEDSKFSAKDDCEWLLFSPHKGINNTTARFHGR